MNQNNEYVKLNKLATGVHGVDHHQIRRYNRALLLNYIREFGPSTRVKIAQKLGLSRATVTNIVEMLLQEGLVHEGSFLDATSRGGRRAILVHFHGNAGYILGVDLGRSHLILLLTNMASEIVDQKAQHFLTDYGPEVCIPQLITLMREFVAQTDITWSQIAGVGLGIPGPLSPDRHYLHAAPHMPGWNDFDIWEALHTALEKPIYIDNDANMGAIAEGRLGAGVGVSDLAYLKIGTGIGAGLIIHGRIYRGHKSTSGEIGHITIDEDGPICDCGNHGCLETFASARVIVAQAQQALQKRNNPLIITDIADVIQAAQNNEPDCSATLAEAGRHIGVALASLINLLNPSTIVIDGSVARAGTCFLDPLRRTAEEASLPAAWNGTRIVSGSLGIKAIAMGAIMTVLDAIFGTLSPESSS